MQYVVIIKQVRGVSSKSVIVASSEEEAEEIAVELMGPYDSGFEVSPIYL
jgi:glutathione synthase/RimK-type ligase-like ATP-grasp enzyme